MVDLVSRFDADLDVDARRLDRDLADALAAALTDLAFLGGGLDTVFGKVEGVTGTPTGVGEALAVDC